VTILLTGATGRNGSEVVRQLAAAGQPTRVMIRRPSRAPLLAGLDVEPLYGDLTSIPSLARAVKGVDVVIHLGGRTPSLLFGQVRHRKVVFPGPGDNPFAQLHVEDAARVLIGAALQRWSGTAAVADDETVNWNDFFEIRFVAFRWRHPVFDRS